MSRRKEKVRLIGSSEKEERKRSVSEGNMASQKGEEFISPRVVTVK